ncbi:hypothetical protein Glove_142g24 [Diversispora epigaea]|uniref:Uncharacterized protein n=1 Tax=Diversispora epigaea TaxID=1348612 RepID=A0A397J464_9GLOM|nr:hypothetical protein Glove_142g24 [Diversispora epigaea]
MEYYELRKLYKTIPSKKQNPFAPRHPFRLLVAGTSESGKTSMVVYLLLGSKYPKIYLWMSGEKRGHKIPKDGSKNFGERYIPCDDLIVVAQHQDEELWEAVQCFYEFIAMDKQAPWYENVKFKLIAPEELHDISSFKRTGRFTRFYETHPNIRENLKYISLHCGCGTLDSIKRILKDIHDNYEPLAKKIYEVIKHIMIIDIRRPSEDPLSIRFK